ncbi:MAG: TRAP transporter substrate-binding protein [Verrucomicrobiae bacterium]|nr:TRAP transporter substrate-binding protein [Verrucomicrobiae bacterium]NNJ86920.1 TRAP transporter substrate-binding protein [Akkermansiaceae bacterium]
MSASRSNIIVGILIGAAVASGIFALTLSKQQDDQNLAGGGVKRNLQIAHSLPTEHPVHQGIVRFADRLNALSGGRITCDIYPSGQLGNETVCLERLQSGSLDFAKVSTAPVSNFVPVMNVFSLPYLFDNEEHYWNTLDGGVGEELLASIETRASGKPSGLVGICYFDAGSRNFYSKVAITKPADLQGKTVRVMRDPVAIAMVEAMGGNPSPMAFGELYSALQQGNVQAAENNPPSFVQSRHLEVCKHFTFDHHSRIPDIFLASATLWDKLSDQEKEWVHTAAREASNYQRKLWKQGTKEALATMEANGVIIHRPPLKPFQDASAPVIKQFAKGAVADYVEKIRNNKP